MNIVLSPRLAGLLIGLLLAILLVTAGWRILLIMLIFALIGYIIGLALESESILARKLRELYIRLFRP
jgi:uncharacterized membrane protein